MFISKIVFFPSLHYLVKKQTIIFFTPYTHKNFIPDCSDEIIIREKDSNPLKIAVESILAI